MPSKQNLKPAVEATLRTFDLDPAHSVAEFAVKHLMIATVTGRLRIRSGTVSLDEADLSRSSVTAEIDAASVDTGVEARDDDLRSENFFHVAQHPAITFRSARVERAGEDAFVVHGVLSLRGVERETTLRVTRDGEIRDPWGGRRAAFTADTTLSRSDFGLRWNQVLETGGVVVGEKVRVTIRVEAVERAAPGAT